MLSQRAGDTWDDLRLRAFIVLGALTACSSAPWGGLKVAVRFFDTDAQCAKVFVTGENNQSQTSGPLLRGGRDRVVGIAQDDFTGPSINVQAKGYLAADCSGTPVDSSKVEHCDFASGQASPDILLVLKGGATAFVDAGPTDAGGVDAGMDAGMIDAGAGPDGGPEQCGNGIDDDRDGLVDCFDGDCLKQDCNFGRRCTSIGVCEVPKTEQLCNDGIDDDKDGLIDCADDDCKNKSCADTNACTFAETCQAKVCTAGLTLSCVSPNECQMGAGSCLPDAGCGYAAKSGSCDGGTCTNGECIVGFPFPPSNGFNPALPSSAIVPRVRLDCGVSTFNSDTLAFGNWCSQTLPIPRVVNRLGVQNIVVLPMGGLLLAGELRLTGSQPVLLAVYGDATITGRLVASARRAVSGAGGPASNCLLQGEPGIALIFSAAGGGGAGFAQAGTKGGNGVGLPLSGGQGGGAYLVPPQTQLRGGCAGGDGASGLAGQQAALGGGAGGAVQLSVSGTLALEGSVSANGGGGAGGVTYNAGGAGAGSGGGILLEANQLKLMSNALVTAHGGGGGGGAREGDDGTEGEEGHPDDSNPAAGGEKGGDQAGSGGKGGATLGPSPAEDGTGSAGGGGGAGAGRIHLRSILTCLASSGRLVSPVATGNCP